MKLTHDFKFKPGDLIKSKMFNGNALYVGPVEVVCAGGATTGFYNLFDQVSVRSSQFEQAAVEDLYELYKSGEEAIK